MKINQLMLCVACDEVSPSATQCPVCRSIDVVTLKEIVPSKPSLKLLVVGTSDVIAEIEAMRKAVEAMDLDEPLGVCV